MTQLRVYYLNGRNILELVRYQKKELPKAVGAEYDVLSAESIIRTEKRKHGEIGKYLEMISHSVSLETKKKVFFQSHMWGL